MDGSFYREIPSFFYLYSVNVKKKKKPGENSELCWFYKKESLNFNGIYQAVNEFAHCQ